MPSRFMYEVAENALDAFCYHLKRPASFKRAYFKLKLAIASYAFVDFLVEEEISREEAFAYAWEDAQMAFVGHADAALTGHVIHLWACIDGSAEKKFRKAIKAAFMAAEVATDDSIVRRYLPEDRLKTPCTLDQLPDLPTLLPLYGVKLREWAWDNGEDPAEIEDMDDFIAARLSREEERRRSHRDEVLPPQPEPPGSHLKLVSNNE